MRISWFKYLFCSALLFLRSFFSSLLFWMAPERVQKMKKVNRNNGVIDVTTVGGRIKKLRTDAGFTQEELAIELHLEGKLLFPIMRTTAEVFQLRCLPS